MKDLQCKMLAYLDGVSVSGENQYQVESLCALTECVKRHAYARPSALRRALRAHASLMSPPYRRWFARLASEAVREATGLAALYRRREQDAGAILFALDKIGAVE